MHNNLNNNYSRFSLSILRTVFIADKSVIDSVMRLNFFIKTLIIHLEHRNHSTPRHSSITNAQVRRERKFREIAEEDPLVQAQKK